MLLLLLQLLLRPSVHQSSRETCSPAWLRVSVEEEGGGLYTLDCSTTTLTTQFSHINCCVGVSLAYVHPPSPPAARARGKAAHINGIPSSPGLPLAFITVLTDRYYIDHSTLVPCKNPDRCSVGCSSLTAQCSQGPP